VIVTLDCGQIFTGLVPYVAIKNDVSVILAVSNGALPQRNDYPGIPDNIWQILQACWKADPAHRPSMQHLTQRFDVIAAPRSTQALVVEHGVLEQSCPPSNTHWRQFTALLASVRGIFRFFYQSVDLGPLDEDSTAS
jgi:hypothetical protein